MFVKPCVMNVLVVSVVVLSIIFSPADGGYSITTPRRWTAGAGGKICLSLTNPSQEGDQIRVSIEKDIQVLAKEKVFQLKTGEQDGCFEMLLPESVSIRSGNFIVSGTLSGKKLSHAKSISIETNPEEIFVQTDKYLYKPGQKVQFRILTVRGPTLEVLKMQYSEIWVENPSGSRIAQWLDVDNSKRLIHMSFELSEEPEEGEYKINVKAESGSLKTTTFKVEDYVLPRYEVTLTPPPYILGVSESALFKVCAKYTFGQPVKGKLVLEVDNGGWGEHTVNLKKEVDISGCAEINVLTEELKISNPNFHAYRINAIATVTEDGTGVILKSEKETIDISRRGITFEDVSLQKFFKPDLPFVGEVKATFPDDSIAANEPVEICSGSQCKNFTTNLNGIVKFALPPHLDAIYIKALNYPGERVHPWRSLMYQSDLRITKKRYHSDSNSSLVIAFGDDELQCTKDTIDFELPVRFSSKDQGPTRVTVQVISRGQIQFTKSSVQDLSIENDLHVPADFLISDIIPSETKSVRGLFTVPVSLPRTVSPKAKIIVWLVRDDGEVVSDHRDVDISKCLLHDVTMKWDKEKAQPGDSTQLSVHAEPSSLCSIGVVDKSVEMLSSDHTSLTIQKLLDVAEKSSVKPYDNKQVNDFEYCRDKVKESDPIEEVNPDVSPLPPVVAMQLQLPALLARTKRSIWHPYYSEDIDALHMFDEAGLYIISNLTLESRPCHHHHGPMSGIVFQSQSPVNFDIISLRRPPGLPRPSIQFALASPQAAGAPAKASSSKKSRTYFPETWLWDLFPMEQDSAVMPLTLPDTVTEWVGSAVCVHATKGVGLSKSQSITTFRDFFVDLTLPATVKRGEIFPVKISVFNYLAEQLPVRVVLGESSEFDILDDIGEVLGSGVRTACIEPQDKTVLSVRIRPGAIGDVNITIDAMVDQNSLECGTGASKARSDVLIKPVKVELEGFPKEETWSKFICSADLEAGKDHIEPWTMKVPATIVPDSARGYVSVVGDLMGPTVENLGGLVKMPSGCGEQNMLNFAPNIFVMQYLDASNQTTDTVAQKSIEFMKTGYQRELNYRHSDGSYSAFGSRDESGSTWLTAFVLRCFFQAREFIEIDPTDFDISQGWLRRKQLENGCFESVGRILHKGMKGGLAHSDSPSLLSAFVLISLMESGESTTSNTVREALFCLSADQSIGPYSLAVRSYALALAKSPDAQPTIDSLLSIANKSSSAISWTTDGEKGSKGIGVETNAYALLALLAFDAQKYKDEAYLIVKWINNQRNGQGGFVSTQDTIVALQAMAAYERMLPSGPIDASVIFNDEDGLYNSAFIVSERNRLLLQKEKLPQIPTTVTGDIAGSGCVLLQGILRYNIPEAEESVAFNISVETSTAPDKGCKTKNIRVCAAYLLSDKVSNMAIIEIHLTSGYIPVKEDLKRIVGYGTGFFKRYEVDGSTVNFYIDEFSAKELCASFNVLREVDVENPKPATVRVYDYYKPEYSVSEVYSLPPTTECVTTLAELPFESEIIPLDPDLPLETEP